MQKSSNPTFKQSLFSDVPTTKKSTMTVSGTYIKTLLLTIIVIASAASSWWWMQDSITSSDIRWWPLWLTSLLAFFVGMVITILGARRLIHQLCRHRGCGRQNVGRRAAYRSNTAVAVQFLRQTCRFRSVGHPDRGGKQPARQPQGQNLCDQR